MTECIEIVIYQIKPEAQANFSQHQMHILQDLKSQPGFINYQTYQCIDDPLCFSDQVKWASQEAAKQAFAQFPHLPHAVHFMECIDKVLFANHFYTCKEK